MPVGDRLARGDKSAQFSGGHATKDEPIELHNVAAEEQPAELQTPFTITDSRPSYDDLPSLSYPEHKYEAIRPVMDRVLIMRVEINPDIIVQADGTAVSRKTGLAIPQKYREHSKTGVVLAAGPFVVLGGISIRMDTILKPGDRVTYGDYNSEIATLPPDVMKQYCEEQQIKRSEDPDDFRIIRVQDIRGVEKKIGGQK